MSTRVSRGWDNRSPYFSTHQVGTNSALAASVPTSSEVAYFNAIKSSKKCQKALGVFSIQSNDMTKMKTETTPRHDTRKTNQEKALDAFCHHLGNARELMTLIRRHLDDHMEVGPDEVTWADVGSAGHVVEELKGVARFLNLISEDEG